MRVYCDDIVTRRPSAPIYGAGMALPCIILAHDNWDDFNYVTSYFVSIYSKNRKLLHSGTIKILSESEKTTNLPVEFESLPETYCSLWQSLEDYKVINSLDIGRDVLSTLNDVNYNDLLRDKFSDHVGFSQSLTRFSDASKAFTQGKAVLNNASDVSNFSFFYDESSKSQTPFGRIRFSFGRQLLGLYRTVGLIGRNGVGKTTLLANLAMALSGMSRNFSRLSPRPPFSKVIAVSYSTFDDFHRPKPDERTFSYFYCGIRGEDELLTQSEINKLFYSSFKRIRQSDRLEFWEKCMNILYLNQLDTYFPDRSKVMPSFKQLSSGQKIMTMSLTQIIDVIDANSILLFDEPETHLHPNGQNTLFKCLDYILVEYDSFAILSTHSAIFIQNIPGSNVLKMTSVQGQRRVAVLPIESFGQHFSTLTEEVFGFSENNLFYVEKLSQILEARDSLAGEYDDLLRIESPGVRYNLQNLQE